MKTIKNFDRWSPEHPHSWPYKVFNQYDNELNRIVMSFSSAKAYNYNRLKKDGAKWDDKACNYLYTHNNKELTVRDWSNSYNLFFNWVVLNELMALSAYFETYISSIVTLSIESDPGLLIGFPHSVDGILLLKQNKALNMTDCKQRIADCTRGDWNARISNLISLFVEIPESLINGLSELEKMRNLRNKVGHAFGRDIEESRNYSLTKITEMEKLKVSAFLKYQKLIRTIACDLDSLLMKKHIGNFQPLFHYHNLSTKIKDIYNAGQKMIALKKSIGQNTNELYSKDFCRWVVSYYQGL